MAWLRLASISILFVTLSLIASSVVSEVTVFREPCPPGNPLCHIWEPCHYNGAVEVSCRDCTTRVICTPLGGWLLSCPPSLLSNCVDGGCTSKPSDACDVSTTATTSDLTPLPDFTTGSSEGRSST